MHKGFTHSLSITKARKLGPVSEGGPRQAQVLSGILEHTAAPEDSWCFLLISVDFWSSTRTLFPFVRPGKQVRGGPVLPPY